MDVQPKQARRSGLRALVIIALATAIAFGASTLGVSALSGAAASSPQFQFPFAQFSYKGGVRSIPATPGVPAGFSLGFTSKFTLATGGSVTNAAGALDDVTIEQDVAYPVPSPNGAVGPIALPFSSDSLSIIVVVPGSCFTLRNGAFVFTGPATCAKATLTLNGNAYDVSSLLTKLTGKVSVAAGIGTTRLGALFNDPGYTFPVVALGNEGVGTVFSIGSNGGSASPTSVTFAS
jgi:hypothetical protein